MKKIYSVVFVALICSMASAQKPSSTSPKPTPIPKATPVTPNSAVVTESPQMNPNDMQAWMTYMTPGPMHKMLASFNGEWNETVTFWMTPDAPPTISKAICTNEMIMGDRYQESNHSGSMNGMPFEGRGYVGFDNSKKVFVSTWFDNMGTGIMNMEGSFDEKKQIIHFIGSSVDPITGKSIPIREEFKIIDSNNQLLEMYMTMNGKEYKSMEIKFTR